MSEPGIEEQAAAVLAFWFEETRPEKRFARDDALDAEIGRRFGTLRERVLETHAAGWRGSPDARLAAIILLDQFSRNLHRGSADAFAADPLARALAVEAIGRGEDNALTPERRAFLYMPFMHSERMSDQVRSIALFEALGLPVQIDFAQRHAEQIAQFGRFPGRNAALGRESTAAETSLLAIPGAAF